MRPEAQFAGDIPQTQEVNLQEVQETAIRLEALIRTIGGNSETTTRVTELDEPNHWNYRTNSVGINPVDLQRHPDEWRGITCHEGMHVRISRFDVLTKDQLRNRGLNNLLQSIEDVRVNSALETMFPGGGKWVRSAMEGEDVEGGRLDISTQSSKVVQELGYVPKSVEYSAELRRIWTNGERSENLSPLVTEVLDNTEAAAFAAAKEIPDVDATEEEIVESAKRSFAITFKQVWPEFQRLLEHDQKTQEMVEFVMHLSLKDGKEDLETLRAELSDAENKELDSVFEKLTEFTIEKVKREAAEASEEIPEETAKFMDLDTLSGSLRSKLANAKENLDARTSRKLRESAEQDLKKAEDRLVEDLRPQMMNPENAPTHEELKELEELAGELKKTLDEIAKQEANKPKEREYDTTDYEQLRVEVEPFVEEAVYKLDAVLAPTKKPSWQPGFPDGQRPNLPQAMRYEVDKQVHETMWERLSTPERRDFRFTVLLDLSKSMNKKVGAGSSRLKEAKKAVVFANEVFDRLDIASEGLGYSANLSEGLHKEVFNEYGEQLDDLTRERIGKVGTIGMTPTAEAIEWAAERQSEDLGAQNFILVMTDGTADDTVALTETLERIKNEDNQHVIGVIMGGGLDTLEALFDQAIIAEDLTQLSEKFADLITDIVTNPQDYL